MNLWKNYIAVRKELSTMKTPFKETIVRAMTAFLFALLIVLGPLTLLINCLIFIDLQVWIKIGFAGFFFLICFLTRFFYFQALVMGRRSMRAFYAMDAIVCLLLSLLLLLLLL